MKKINSRTVCNFIMAITFISCAWGLAEERDLTPIKTISEVCALPPEEASKALPVDIRAQIVRSTFSGNGVFLFDGTAGIYASDVTQLDLFKTVKVGDVLQVRGTTSPGEFAPSLETTAVAVLSHEPLPEARSLRNNDFSDESIDCDWVKLSGRIIEVKAFINQKSILVVLERNGMCMDVQVPLHPGYLSKMREKLFEWVEFSAVAGVVSNPQGQFAGRVLYTDSPDDFTVLENKQNQKQINMLPLHELRKYGTDSRRVIQTKGVVTYARYGQLFIQTEQGGLKSTKPPAEGPNLGQEIILEGLIAPGEVSPEFRASGFETTGVWHKVEPQFVDLQTELDSGINYKLIKTQAELVEVWSPLIAPDRRDLVLLCRSGNKLVEARLRRGYEEGQNFEIGSIVELTGICQIQRSDTVPWHLSTRGMWIQLRNKDDIRIVKLPPWWNKMRLIWVGSLVSGISLAFLVWIILLRKTVERQMGIISKKVERESILEERQRIARELHDSLAQGLTGAAVRLESSRWLLNHTNEEFLSEFQKQVPDGVVDRAGAEFEGIVKGLRSAMDKTRGEFKVVQDMLTYCGEESRASIMDLRGGLLEEVDLPAAIQYDLQQIADEADAELNLKVIGAPRRLKRMAERNLLMVAREATANAVRNGNATRLKVTLQYTDSSLSLAIDDNGNGFDLNDQPTGHFGIRGMRERINRLNGEIHIKSKIEKGTQVEIQIPSLDEWELNQK